MLFFGYAVPGVGGAFLAGCWVLFNTDISSPGFISIIASFFRQGSFSIATTAPYAMCAYGEA
jgi:hypothetical protein